MRDVNLMAKNSDLQLKNSEFDSRNKDYLPLFIFVSYHYTEPMDFLYHWK